MSATRHIHDVVAEIKAGHTPTGWQADMMLLEIVAIEEACRIVVTGRGSTTSSVDYGAARNLLTRVANVARFRPQSAKDGSNEHGRKP